MPNDDKDLDLGLNPSHSAFTREEAAKKPCFGGCGTSWDDAGGGWFEFEQADTGGTQLAPRWYCTPCSNARSSLSDNYPKAGAPPTQH